MINDDIKVIKRIIKRDDIVGIIQHGSTAQKVAGPNSDRDFYVILKGKPDDPIYAEMTKNGKYHILVSDREGFYNDVKNFVPSLMKVLFDTNIIAGRLLQGKVILDSNDHMISNFLSDQRKKVALQKKILIKKFRYQAIGFMRDSQYNNLYFEMNCIEKAIDSIAIAILIKNDFYNLNPKWQPIFLKEFIDKDLYKKYINLRFYLLDCDSKEVETTLSLLLKEIQIQEIRND